MAASQTWGSAWAPRDARKAAELWREYVQTVRAAAKNLSDENFLEIRYEELLNAPQENLQRVPNFLGLHWSEEEIRQAIERNCPTSGTVTPIPLYGEVANREGPFVKEPQGFVRQGLSGAWKSELSLLDRLRIWRVATR